ncbi:MAG TPA: transporter [Longimicrobium sp.]|nr:transporter [Longimicrobium sp.]
MTIRNFAAAAAVLAMGAAARPAAAQTDYYNTDKGRPVQVEDAYAVERYAFELQLAPVRLEREGGGAYTWEVAPELAYGILPRTQLEVGFPLVFRDGGEDGGGAEGLGGIEVAALHNLNVETRTLPAFAVGAEVLLPVGGLGPDRAYTSLKGIATRTFSWARFHLNGQYTPGSDEDEDDEVGEASRWMAGIAVDRAFPLRSLLVTADLFAEQPLADDAEPAWTAEAGFRYQTSPQFNIDFGVGRRFAGGEQGWFLTFGAAHAFAVRSLLPIR